MLIIDSKSQDKEDVESDEADQNEEDLEHQLSITWCVFVDLSELFLSCFNIVESFFCILVYSGH